MLTAAQKRKIAIKADKLIDSDQFPIWRDTGEPPKEHEYLSVVDYIIRHMSSHDKQKYAEALQDAVALHCVGVVPDYHRDLRSLAMLSAVQVEIKVQILEDLGILV